MTRPVTVGTDGSQESAAAADWAAEEALLRDRELVLAHVDFDPADPVVRYVDPETRRRWAAELLDAAAAHVRGAHPGVRLETHQYPGDPVAGLAELSGTSDLLVLGSRGLGAAMGFLAGSVSLAVLARARGPVTLVRAPLDGGATVPDGDVVAGVDIREDEDAVLRYACEAARRHGSGLRLVHSWAPPMAYSPYSASAVPMLASEIAAQRRKKLGALVEKWATAYPDIEISGQCRQGSAALDVVEAARESRLVVVGLRSRHSALGLRVGPVVHAVLHHSTAPVAVVPHDGTVREDAVPT
ncbi:universal stress protein [Streptomyces solincola]|uniref:Universal stress protein n=1 Tax=Streptomyces solincola TaxID=2100817 RepID=A0A2S9Q299_9ACTN|nr:universal stress protein [Streptomyces solincola]PRH80772.1 universal stress protein [Streptomyces solincola]